MDANSPCRLAVLVSGSGTNLQTIIDLIESGALNATITCVISNKPAAFAVTRAKKHNIPVVIHENRLFPDRRDYDTTLVEILRDHNVKLVVMAGFMRILTDIMVNAFPAAIMNIHPALLPSFPGLHAQQQALDHGVRFSGCTVHFVDSGTDTGPIILQAVVPVEQDDDAASLSAKIQKEEHQLFPAAIRLFVEGRLAIAGRCVKIFPPVG